MKNKLDMNLLLLEWKLLTGNKRLKQQLIVSMLILPFLIFLQLAYPQVRESFFRKENLLFLLFVCTIPNFSLIVFCINAAFIEKQVTTPLPIYKIVKAKYRLYCILSLLLFIAFLPSVYIGIKILELAGAFLFCIGFIYFGVFIFSLFTYKPFNVKSSGFFNYQGQTVGMYIYAILLVAVAYGFVALFYFMYNETVALIAMSVIGLVFIATNRIWLGFIAQRFEKTKHYRLERFNEK